MGLVSWINACGQLMRLSTAKGPVSSLGLNVWRTVVKTIWKVVFTVCPQDALIMA